MLKCLWPRRSVADSEDIVLFYTAHILIETALKAFVCCIFFPAVLQILKFSIRVILLEEEESVLFMFFMKLALPGWESRLEEHQIHSETSGHPIKLTEEIQDARFTQALNWNLYTGGALEGYKSSFFYKDWSAQPQLWGTLVNHGVRKLTFVIRMRHDSYENSWRKLKWLKNRKLLEDS